MKDDLICQFEKGLEKAFETIHEKCIEQRLWDKDVYPYTGILFSNKQECSSDKGYNMNEP